jgi:hypothetical protein
MSHRLATGSRSSTFQPQVYSQRIVHAQQWRLHKQKYGVRNSIKLALVFAHLCWGYCICIYGGDGERECAHLFKLQLPRRGTLPMNYFLHYTYPFLPFKACITAWAVVSLPCQQSSITLPYWSEPVSGNSAAWKRRSTSISIRSL